MSTAAVILPGPKFTPDCLPEGQRTSAFNNLALAQLPGTTVDPFSNQTGQAILSQIASVYFQFISGLYDASGQDIVTDPPWELTISDGGFQVFNFLTPVAPVPPPSGSPSTLGQALITGCIPLRLLPGGKITVAVSNPIGGTPNTFLGSGTLTMLAFNTFVSPFLHVDVFGMSD